MRRVLIFTVSALVASAVAAAPALASFQYIRSFGSGNGHEVNPGPGQLSSPQQVAFGADGRLLVVDGMNSRIELFAPTGAFSIGFGSIGSGPGQFNQPQGIAVGSAGQIYVSDFYKRIQVFSRKLAYASTFGTAQLVSPSAIAVGTNGDVYVADAPFIRQYHSDGTYVQSFGSKGTGDGQFSSTIPALATDRLGNVYAADYSGGRVEEFDGGGTFLRSIASGAVAGPIGVAVNRAGAVFISDNNNVRAVEYSAAGKLLRVFGNSGAGKLDDPGSLAIDCAGNVYVSDIDAGRIREYGDPSLPLPPCSPPRVSGFRVSPHRVVAGHAATMRFKLSVTATVTLRIERRRKDGTFHLVVALKPFKAAAGSGSRRLPAKPGGHPLRPGSYRVVIVARSALGTSSAPRRAAFTVVKS